MSENLFEQAIADAKKIREVAEENAKKAVLEAVTPKIKEFIENSILEQDEEIDEEPESGDAEEEEVVLDETAITSLLDLMESGHNQDNKKSLVEAVSRLDDDEKKKIFDMIKNSNSNNISHSRDIYTLKENKMTSREKFYEIDLKALREAVEEDMEEMIYEEEEDDLLSDDLPDMAGAADDAPDAMDAGEDMISKDGRGMVKYIRK